MTTPAASKTPSKLFIPILAGLSEHTKDGRVTPIMFCTFWTMLHEADFETGIWHGCAEKVRIDWNYNFGLRNLQRAIKDLCNGGYARSFQKNGQRGNYSVAINKYPVRFGTHKGKCLNATLTDDPRRPVYEDDPRQPNEGQTNSESPRAQKSKGRNKHEKSNDTYIANDRDNGDEAVTTTAGNSSSYGGRDRGHWRGKRPRHVHRDKTNAKTNDKTSVYTEQYSRCTRGSRYSR